MDLVKDNIELAGSRLFNAKDNTLQLTDSDISSLTTIIQACQIKDGEERKSSLLKARAFCNMEAGHEVITVPTGVMTLHDDDSAVTPEMITSDMFQYLVVIPLHLEHAEEEYDDAYFQTEEQRQRIDEAIPQYGGNAYSIDRHRSREDNSDIRVWEAELGQDNGWSGIIKTLHENGDDFVYYAASRAGSPYACDQLRGLVAKSTEGSTPMTWVEFSICDEVGAVRANAMNNARRLAFNVGLACSVIVPSVQDGLSHGKTKASMAGGATMMTQAISTIATTEIKDLERAPLGQCTALYREVTPTSSIGNHMFVLGSAADPMVQFHMDRFRPNDVGVPCTTGRKTPLPATVADANQLVEQNPALKKRHAKLAKRFVWEGADQLKYHPDINPESHYRALDRKDQTFVDQLCQLGWSRREGQVRFVPVLVKMSNPYLKRPKTVNKTSKTTQDIMADFD